MTSIRGYVFAVVLPPGKKPNSVMVPTEESQKAWEEAMFAHPKLDIRSINLIISGEFVIEMYCGPYTEQTHREMIGEMCEKHLRFKEQRARRAAER